MFSATTSVLFAIKINAFKFACTFPCRIIEETVHVSFDRCEGSVSLMFGGWGQAIVSSFSFVSLFYSHLE